MEISSITSLEFSSQYGLKSAEQLKELIESLKRQIEKENKSTVDTEEVKLKKIQELKAHIRQIEMHIQKQAEKSKKNDEHHIH
ncbi:MAG: hypothetical protein C0412_04430 [Flavobacterium sp.]|nr:hypothetical protein [Flavobacterium sp.]